MMEVHFQLEDRLVVIEVSRDGELVATKNIEVTPAIATDILQAIQEMLQENGGKSQDISKSTIKGELSGSSAMRTVSVISQTLTMVGSRENLTQ